MRKLLFSAGLFLLLVSSANAQDIFRKGAQRLNAGIGIGSGIPVEVSYERSVVDGLIQDTDNGAIGVGAYASWYHDNTANWSYNYYILGARGAFHYQFVEKLDTYAGLMLGYNIATSSWAGNGAAIGTASGSAFTFSTFIGARYFFKPSIGVYAEAGYGISFISAGVTFSF
jgi:hypothetical protein